MVSRKSFSICLRCFKADQNTFNDLVGFNVEEPYKNVEARKSHASPVNENDNASQNNNDEILNTSCISDTDEVMGVKVTIIDKDTSIYQILKMMNSLMKMQL